MAERKVARDWLRELARAGSDGSPVVDAKPRAVGPKTSVRGGPVLMAHELAFVQQSLVALGTLGPEALSPTQRAALFMTPNAERAALACGIPRPAPEAVRELSPAMEAEALAQWRLRKARKAAPAPEAKPKTEMEELGESLDARLGKGASAKLTIQQMRKLDAALDKLDREGPDALEPKESADLFLTKASAAIAMDKGFQKPLDNPWNEFQAEAPMTLEQKFALRKASQFDQAAGVEFAKGAALSQDDSQAEREAKSAMFNSAAARLTGMTPAAGLASVARKLMDEREAEREMRRVKELEDSGGPQAPSPFSIASRV